MNEIRILAIPAGEYRPSDGPGFKPYEQSPDVWVLQVHTGFGWKPVPVVKQEKVNT